MSFIMGEWFFYNVCEVDDVFNHDPLYELTMACGACLGKQQFGYELSGPLSVVNWQCAKQSLVCLCVRLHIHLHEGWTTSMFKSKQELLCQGSTVNCDGISSRQWCLYIIHIYYILCTHIHLVVEFLNQKRRMSIYSNGGNSILSKKLLKLINLHAFINSVLKVADCEIRVFVE